MPHVVAIVGPTGTGKTRLAIRLAQSFDGEIINADSRQIYRRMDIGTAKPTIEERSRVTHHVLDIINPNEDFSLAQYQEIAGKSIADIHDRGKLPMLVGGTGLYVWAVVEGWEIPRVPPDPKFRQQLEERAARGEGDLLYEELTRLDPEAARKIDAKNLRRVIRALEVSQSTGVPFSQLQRKKTPPFQTLVIGLTADRRELYHRTDARVDRMIETGLVGEVKGLVEMGYGPDLPSMSGIGYRQIGDYLEGRLTLEHAVQQTKTETHRFIRHQYGWFRISDPRIKWFDVEGQDFEEKAGQHVAEFLGLK